MTDNGVPTDLKDFGTLFLQQIDKIRGSSVTLLAEAPQTYPEKQKSGLCERTFQMNDYLEAMYTNLWRMVSLVDRAEGEGTSGTGGDQPGNPGA